MSLVGVVGAGVMGVGVAQSLAEHGHEVVLVDIDDETVARAARKLDLNVRTARMFGGTSQRSPQEVMAAVRCSTNYGDLGDVDFVIENITEKWELKARAYRELDTVCPRNAIFCANTSAIPITRIGGATTRPERVIGIHFMNPVPMKNTVELIPGHHTSDETVKRTEELLTSIGKRAIAVRDSPGFVSNRVLMLTINEAAFLVHEKVADAAAVDDVFVSCFGHPMGPLATADLIGIDTILYSIEVLYESFSDSKYRPCPLLRQMVDAGLHGKKTGKGFFSYS
jgi:3-hydroxybutyryl-CoA dehydrogenase